MVEMERSSKISKIFFKWIKTDSQEVETVNTWTDKKCEWFLFTGICPKYSLKKWTRTLYCKVTLILHCKKSRKCVLADNQSLYLYLNALCEWVTCKGRGRTTLHWVWCCTGLTSESSAISLRVEQNKGIFVPWNLKTHLSLLVPWLCIAPFQEFNTFYHLQKDYLSLKPFHTLLE